MNHRLCSKFVHIILGVATVAPTTLLYAQQQPAAPSSAPAAATAAPAVSTTPAAAAITATTPAPGTVGGPVVTLPYPAGMTLPWRIVGIDSLERSAARPALAQALTALRAAWLNAPQSLTAYIAGRNVLTINRQRLTDQMFVGTPRQPGSPPAISVEPMWCSFMDRHVFIVTVTDTKLNTLLGAAHVTMPRQRWKTLANGRGPYLTAQIPALAQQALQQAQARGGAPATDALHVGLALARNVTRHDEGASTCVNQLLEAKLAANYTVARALGVADLATVRDVLGQPAALRRPTRGLVLNWTNPSESEIAKNGKGIGPTRRLPVTLTLAVSMAETVFGGHVPVTHASRWAFTADGDTLGFNVDPGFKKLLDDEQIGLQLADAPQVAHIDRAWVYLDRGRAWGLKMNDRLVADVDGEIVKGHVVRFFGPEAGLKSPRGFPIREGAIVYIRKGQAKTSVGLEFRMDPRQYPTPYPIPPGG